MHFCITQGFLRANKDFSEQINHKKQRTPLEINLMVVIQFYCHNFFQKLVSSLPFAFLFLKCSLKGKDSLN